MDQNSQTNQHDYENLRHRYQQSILQRQKTTKIMSQQLTHLQSIFYQTSQKLSECQSQILTFKQLIQQQQQSLSKECEFLKQIMKVEQLQSQKSLFEVDQLVPNREKCFVLRVKDKNYHTVMNHSDVFINNNKFYIVQVLGKLESGEEFYTFMRWGRVGCPGQNALMGPMKRSEAIEKYENKIKDKLKSGYALIEIMAAPDQAEKQIKEEVPQKIEMTPLKKLANILSTPKYFQQELLNVGYDCKKLPVTKIMNPTLKQAFEVLIKIKKQLNNPTQQTHNTITALSGNFYTLIPHDFGFCKMSNFILNTHQKVNNKFIMLEMISKVRDSMMLMENIGALLQKVKYIEDKEQMLKLKTQVLGIPEEIEGWQFENIFDVGNKKQDVGPGKRSYWLRVEPSEILLYLQSGLRETQFIPDQLLPFGQGIYVKPTLQGALPQASKTYKNTFYFFVVQVSSLNGLSLSQPNPKARETYSTQWDYIKYEQLLSQKLVEKQICIFNPEIISIRYFVQLIKK